MNFEEFKKALGNTGEKLSDQELLKLMATFEYLADKWLDQTEIALYGKTLKDLVDDC